ncbi:TonB-dependent receptor [Methylopila sp. M107]|uniref:TonB-dependent receptor family protein n=1 Tax=Methylopila sp. M107 TaxID=1101190 RepID=UPI0003679EDF|nr:TonB-dependent receptor [Methylopila sp. M107]
MSRFLTLAGASIACAAASLPLAPAALADEHNLEEIRVEGAGRPASLTVPSLEETRRELERTPGAVEVIDAEDYKRSTPAMTIKDVLDYTPGVFAQPKWGDDTRLSIRGSGLSRNFHLRGVQLYMDGIPINTADGYGDFQEIDPSAYRLIEVYKGANALRFGANALGGAINFVTPSGRDANASVAQGALDAGAFGFLRAQASTSGVHGKADWFVTGAAQRANGFRDHSEGDAQRMSANLGYQFSDDVETRFYFNANTVDQNIPGAVTRDGALRHPKRAALGNILRDQERNIDTFRFANKTTVRFGETTRAEFGAFAADRHLMHPIFQWLDYRYFDYGGFARVTDEREIDGRANRFVAGVNLHNGRNDAQQFVNARDVGSEKGPKTFDATQTSSNVSLYGENTHYVVPSVGVVTGLQFLYAKRRQNDHFFEVDANRNDSGTETFSLASPKVGVLWDVDPSWQVFANVSRSVEAPSFGENNFTNTNPTIAKAQKAWTAEIGTRGRREDFTWDAAVYRAHIRDELQCQDPNAAGACSVVNLDKTIHQGVELGFGAAILKGLFVEGYDGGLVTKDGVKEGAADKLWLNVAYTFSDFRFDGGGNRLFYNPAIDPTSESLKGNKLPGAPRHFIRAELLYKHPAGFFAGPNVEWVPQAYYVDNANTEKTKRYALLGAKAGYDAGGAFSAYVEARNLTNEKYISSVSIAGRASDRATGVSKNLPLYEPGAGRALYAGVKYRW